MFRCIISASREVLLWAKSFTNKPCTVNSTEIIVSFEYYLQCKSTFSCNCLSSTVFFSPLWFIQRTSLRSHQTQPGGRADVVVADCKRHEDVFQPIKRENEHVFEFVSVAHRADLPLEVILHVIDSETEIKLGGWISCQMCEKLIGVWLLILSLDIWVVSQISQSCLIQILKWRNGSVSHDQIIDKPWLLRILAAALSYCHSIGCTCCLWL